MTPIIIEPNSGVKMAGVRIVLKHWLGDCDYEEIIFVGSKQVFTKDKEGKEKIWNISNGWCLYEEPKAEVKKVLMSMHIGKNSIGIWTIGHFLNAQSKPARVVLKNVEQEGSLLGNKISADLYFEVEE